MKYESFILNGLKCMIKVKVSIRASNYYNDADAKAMT